MAKSEVKKIIKMLKTAELCVFNVPKKYKNNAQIAITERKLGIRVTGRRGFDAISKTFFVEEELVNIDDGGCEREKEIFSTFNDFDTYFDFLNGDIYKNACYTYIDSATIADASRMISIRRLMKNKAFVEKTIDYYSLPLHDITSEEKAEYEDAERIHRACKFWVNKFNRCGNQVEFSTTVKAFFKSSISHDVHISFFIFQYLIKGGVPNKQRLFIIMNYLSSGEYPSSPFSGGPSLSEVLNAFCTLFNPDTVIGAFKYAKKSDFHKRKVKKYISLLKNKEIGFAKYAYFDKISHYYCIEVTGKARDPMSPEMIFRRYFENFEDFVACRKGDLTYCDLTGAYELNADISKCIINETTMLPAHLYKKVSYSVKKWYDGKFYVLQQWKNEYGSTVKEYKHVFSYFFDFVAFLKGDLSGANLVLCDGLANIKKYRGIDFTDAKMTSDLYDRFGMEYSVYKINESLLKSFKCTEQNERDTSLSLKASSELSEIALEEDNDEFGYENQKVHYISDIHLLHKIKNANCRAPEDVKCIVGKIVRNIENDAEDLLLIDGDIASDFELFCLFVKMLRRKLDGYTTVVFTLGNHELWSFPGLSINDIVEKYRTFLNENGMYLLQNDILYKTLYNPSNNQCEETIHLIKYEDLCRMNDEQIIESVRSSQYVILGGLGFSGYNVKFNADNGIYRGTLDRRGEVEETKKFEALYNRLYPILKSKNTIILTHTPKCDWCSNPISDRNVVYVSGHTHKNIFFDDGEYREYSDNQIGYNNNNPHLKSFLMDFRYDCFGDYGNGIYEIAKEQYIDFYLGKNMPMTFQREANVIYMLKKDGYYCFIHKSKRGTLALLDGGNMKNLSYKNVQYYYDNMDVMINTIKTPLDAYSEMQNQISEQVKRIGGDGTIHGCIIDIDFYNHIYVNPVDSSVVGYWASDIEKKIPYSAIPELLFGKRFKIPSEYRTLAKADNCLEHVLICYSLVAKQQLESLALPMEYYYLNTDIYKASRKIRKMQRLYSNVLRVWEEDYLHNKTNKALKE